ncbi:MAG: hypothetical protein CSA94_02725, partial [Bacteroidetes bacterium]
MGFFSKQSIKNNWTYGVVFLLAFMLYGNTILNDYSLDDNYVTKGNPKVAKGIKGIPEILSSHYAELYNDDGQMMSFGYRPVVNITYAIEYELFG